MTDEQAVQETVFTENGIKAVNPARSEATKRAWVTRNANKAQIAQVAEQGAMTAQEAAALIDLMRNITAERVLLARVEQNIATLEKELDERVQRLVRK